MKFTRKILVCLGILGISLLAGCKGEDDILLDKKGPFKPNPKPGSVAYLEKKRKEIKTPRQAQDLVSSLEYDSEDANVDLGTGFMHHYEVDSPKVTLKEGKAHCLEAALLAAYLLEDDGYDDKILFMWNRKFGHAVYVYQNKENSLWSSIGQSRAEYLKGRKPKYKTIKELFESYNKGGFLKKYGKFIKFSVRDISKKYPKDWATRDKPLIKG